MSYMSTNVCQHNSTYILIYVLVTAQREPRRLMLLAHTPNRTNHQPLAWHMASPSTMCLPGGCIATFKCNSDTRPTTTQTEKKHECGQHNAHTACTSSKSLANPTYKSHRTRGMICSVALCDNCTVSYNEWSNAIIL